MSKRCKLLSWQEEYANEGKHQKMPHKRSHMHSRLAYETELDLTEIIYAAFTVVNLAAITC